MSVTSTHDETLPISALKHEEGQSGPAREHDGGSQPKQMPLTGEDRQTLSNRSHGTERREDSRHRNDDTASRDWQIFPKNVLPTPVPIRPQYASISFFSCVFFLILNCTSLPSLSRTCARQRQRKRGQQQVEERRRGIAPDTIAREASYQIQSPRRRTQEKRIQSETSL